jgi:hypothetical protein
MGTAPAITPRMVKRPSHRSVTPQLPRGDNSVAPET